MLGLIYTNFLRWLRSGQQELISNPSAWAGGWIKS
jgi:hypothetical protein